MAAQITERNQEELLGMIFEELAAIRLDLDQLREAWQLYEPVVSAFRRGGMLAARTAARNGRRNDR